MRPLGPAEGHILTANAGSGTGSRAGVSVSLLVEERLGPGLYRASSGGASYLLRSKTELSLGSLVQALLPPGSGLAGAGLPGAGASLGGAGLAGAAAPRAGSLGAGHPGAGGAPAPVAPGGAAALLSRLGLPDDGASRLALAALLAEGQRPEGPALRRVRNAALRGAPGEEASWAELAARLEAKGLGATDAAVEALGDALSGEGGGGDGGTGGSAGGGSSDGGQAGGSTGDGVGGGDGGSGGSAGGGSSDGGQAGGSAGNGADGRGGPEGRGQGAAGPTAAELERGFRREVAEEELPALLGGLLRGLAGRSSPRAGILGLFNHARGPEGGWVALPFRFSLDAVDFRGSLRILLPYIVGGPGRMEARFFAARKEAEASAWGFDLSFGGGRTSSLVLRAEGRRGEAERRLADLAETLAASDCSVRLAGSGEPEPPPEGRLDLGA